MPSVDTFHAISLLYAVAALAVLWRLAREWRALLDDEWTPRDRDLAQLVGILLLTPPAVWLHEWAHATAMRGFGADDPRIHFFLYWGYVTSSRPFGPPQQFAVSLAGPLVTYLLGVLALAVALLVPLRPALALALAIFAVAQLALVLILYPAWSLLGGWGDFSVIYSGRPLAPSVAVGAVHVASLVGFLWLMKRPWMQRFWLYPRPLALRPRPTRR
jgi:hypothetical protein